ncbi:MAG: methyltransferase domain-containing protein [Candidatus Latescibacteria bacterium]|nr:methyltransferase domain-containing protein [Candidatus Latescibacterota bacterium]
MPDIIVQDEIAARNLELVREAHTNGGKGMGGAPFMDLDVQAYDDYRAGRRPKPPDQDDNPDTVLMKRDLEGKNVLCLAGGGGQHSVIFSLLGANVTVFDLTPEQLELDQKAADHYGYEVRTVQGDMRDLSNLPKDHFDRVYQPISSLYVPDMSQVYDGVADILKPGGLYYSAYTYPRLYMAEHLGWDGNGFTVRFSQPHRNGKILEREGDDLMNFEEGVFLGEFNHLLSDIINGQIEKGLTIVGVWENPRPHEFGDAEMVPGSKEHEQSVFPYGLSVLSKRPQ